MINKVISWVAKIAVGKQLVSAVAWAHNALDGHRSELNVAIIALVHVLKLTGTIPADTADGIEKALAAILPVTLADKVAKVKSAIDNVAPEPPKANDSVEPPKA